MILIPLQRVEKQSLSVLLDNVLHQIAVLECNGIMAVNISRAGVPLIQGRRAVCSVPLIPAGPRETGNFVFKTLNDELPYWSEFGNTQQLFYLTIAEMEALRNG